jgi:hypothetical protein
VETTMRTFYPVWHGVQNGFCDFLNNPTLWSDEMIKQTLERSGTKTYNIEDCRTIVKDYLSVLCSYIRQGSTNYGTW